MKDESSIRTRLKTGCIYELVEQIVRGRLGEGTANMITVWGEGRGFRFVWPLEEMGLPYRLRGVGVRPAKRGERSLRYPGRAGDH